MPRSIHLLLWLHLLLGLAFNYYTPIFEPPDEDGHFLFVRYLQEQRALPVQTLDPDAARAHHPPLYFVLGALLSAWAPNPGPERVDLTLNPHAEFRYGDPNIDNKAVWLHYTPAERWPYHGQALAVHVTRLLSLMFSTLAVWLTYLTARYIKPRDEPLALLAAGLIALNGTVLAMSAAVQNSTASITATALVLYGLARFTRQGFSTWRWGLIGLAWSVGILLQTSALALAAPIGLGLLYQTWRARLRGQFAKQSWMTVFQNALACVLPVSVFCGWWFWRNQQLYGDWTANAVIGQLWGDGPLIEWPVALYLLGTGLVGRFGQGLMIDYPVPLYWLAGGAALLALFGLARQRRRPRWRLTRSMFLWGVCVVTIVAVSGALAVYVVKYIHGLQGRYLFPAFPPLALLLALGALNWGRGASRLWITFAILGGNLLLTLYGLFGLLAPTYALPRPLLTAEQAQLTPLDANFADTAQLLGYRLSATLLKPGDTLRVTLQWRVLSRTDAPYTIFVHVYSPDIGSIAQQDIYPGLGNYATTVWDVGYEFADTYRLRVPTDAPGASYQLLVGLYNEATGQRLSVTGSGASATDDWVAFGMLQIQP